MTENTADQEPQTEVSEPEEPKAEAPKPAPVDDVVESGEPEFPPVESELEAKGVIEALLFSSPKSLSVRRLASMMPGWKERQVLDILTALKDEYDEKSVGLMLQEVAGGWTIATRPQWAEWVYGLHRTRKRNPLTPQALETLAIVAYKQPITRADIEVIRGVDAGGMLRNLLDLNLVEIVGHRETVGRPPLYGTGDLFLRTFGLKSLSDLPSVEELKNLMRRTEVVPPPTEETDEEAASESDESPAEEQEEAENVDEEIAEEGENEDDEDEDEFDDDDDDDEDDDDEKP